MANIWDKWNDQFAEKLDDSIAELNENGGNGEFEKVPYGDYEVRVEGIELKKCKSEKNKGENMLCIEFKILTGEYKNRRIFYNKLISAYDFMRHQAVDLLASLLDVPENDTLKVKGRINSALKAKDSMLEEFLMDLHEEIDKFEYLLGFDSDKKGYDTFSIDEVYEAEQLN